MKITSAKPLSEFLLELQFDDGTSGVVDLSGLAGRGVFAAWNPPGVFEQVTVTEFGGVAWPGEIDLCPDALYLQATGKRVDEVFPAVAERDSHA